MGARVEHAVKQGPKTTPCLRSYIRKTTLFVCVYGMFVIRGDRLRAYAKRLFFENKKYSLRSLVLCLYTSTVRIVVRVGTGCRAANSEQPQRESLKWLSDITIRIVVME